MHYPAPVTAQKTRRSKSKVKSRSASATPKARKRSGSATPKKTGSATRRPSRKGSSTPRPKKQLTNAQVRRMLGFSPKRRSETKHIHIPNKGKTPLEQHFNITSSRVENIDTLFVPVTVNKHHGVFDIIPMSESGRSLPHEKVRLEIDIRTRKVRVNGKDVADLNYVKSSQDIFSHGKAQVASFMWNPFSAVVKNGVNAVKRAGKSITWLLQCISIVINQMSDVMYLAVGAVAIYIMVRNHVITPEMMNKWGLGKLEAKLLDNVVIAINNSKLAFEALQRKVMHNVVDIGIPAAKWFAGHLIQI
jgi:hypothetical protein